MKSNRENLEKLTPIRKHCDLVDRSMQRLEHREKVKVSQDGLADELHERRICWLQRAEQRAERRRQEEEEARREFEHHKRCSDWLLYLFLNMVTQSLADRYAKQKKAIQEWWEQNFAAGKIQSGW